MKFTCEKDTLLKEISITQEIVSKTSSSLSILSNVLLVADSNTLYIKATNLKVSFETKIPIEVTKPGSVTVLCDKLMKNLRNLPPGDIEFEALENDVFVIKPLFKKIDIQLRTIPADKFPEIPSCENEKFFELSQKDILEMISHTSFAISHDVTRYFMNGVYFEQNEGRIVMVATDGRRLSYISKQPENAIPEFNPIIIPDKALNLIRKLASGEGTISLAINDKNVFFAFDNQNISTTLIEGNFPNYQKVIPSEQTHRITINREDISEAVKRIFPNVDQKTKRIYINMKNGSFTLSSEESEVDFAREEDIDFAREEIPCDYEGEEVTFALNCLYLSDPLREIGDDAVILEYTDPGKAITLRSAQQRDYFHIIMPMQLE
ncbi:MAG: DNA polymerase III subunit beta [Spirochaetia bacterium]|jgi:DNA polymerase-3 subunit beta|nr:DNA polymerase III subunit beta [Spirochaetia bacterium]